MHITPFINSVGEDDSGCAPGDLIETRIQAGRGMHFLRHVNGLSFFPGVATRKGRDYIQGFATIYHAFNTKPLGRRVAVHDRRTQPPRPALNAYHFVCGVFIVLHPLKIDSRLDDSERTQHI